MQMSAAVDDLETGIGVATEVGVSAKYAKKVLKRLQRQLEAALNPPAHPPPERSSSAQPTNDAPSAPLSDKLREPAPQKQQPQPQPLAGARSRPPAAAAQPAPRPAHAPQQPPPPMGSAWGGASGQVVQGAAGTPPPLAPRPATANGPLPHVSTPPLPPLKLAVPERPREHAVPPSQLPAPAPGPQPRRISPPPPPPPQVQSHLPPAYWQQQQQQQLARPDSLYSQPLTAKLVPPQPVQGPRPGPAPLPPGSWGSTPGTPVSWQDAQIAAAQRGPFGGHQQMGGMGMPPQQQQVQPQQHSFMLGAAGLRGIPIVQPPPPPPPPGLPRRSTEFKQQVLPRQGSLGRQSPMAGQDAAGGPFRGNGTPHAADLCSGSSLFAHPVFPPSVGLSESAGGRSGDSTPLSARTVGSLGAFEGKPGQPGEAAGVGGFGAAAFEPFPLPALPAPEAAAAQRREELQPAPLQLTQSHFGPTVSANGPQRAHTYHSV